MDKAKILITGVAGFIGSHLAERLLALGYEVLGIDNFSSGFKHNINHLLSNESFTFKEGDYKNIPFATLPKLSGIFHLASGKIPREPTDDGLQTLTDTMLGLSWISSIWKSNQCRLVFSSTSEVYGELARIPFREDEPISIGLPSEKRWVYAISKIHTEHFIAAFGRQHGLEYSVGRLFSVYGPRQHPSWKGGVQAAFIEKIRKGEPIEIHGSGNQKRVFTYINDTIDALILLFESNNAKNLLFNIQGLAKDEISVWDLAQKIILIGGFNPSTYPIHYHSEIYSNGEDQILAKVADIHRAKSLLNWTPKIGLDQGLRLIL